MKKRLLVHFCCAPCGMEVVPYFKKDFEIVGFWCNPNIQPIEEYALRKQSLQRLEKDATIKCFYFTEEVDQWKEEVKTAVEQGKDRCAVCYAFRLQKAFEYMQQERIDYFTTTLLASPYQKHDTVKKAGEKIGEDTFLYRDFRPLYYRGKNTAYQRGYYLQKYCGCFFSQSEKTAFGVRRSAGRKTKT